MTEVEETKMDAKRLEEVVFYLYPDAGKKSWKQRIADELGIYATTVRRWVNKDEVPRIEGMLLESMAALKKLMLEARGLRKTIRELKK